MSDLSRKELQRIADEFRSERDAAKADAMRAFDERNVLLDENTRLRAELAAERAARARQDARMSLIGGCPVQPLDKDEHGTIRFKQNAIVRFLLDAGPFDLNRLGLMNFSDEDRTQFAQLIGYSLSGFSELSYVSDADYERARAQSEKREARDA